MNWTNTLLALGGCLFTGMILLYARPKRGPTREQVVEALLLRLVTMLEEAVDELVGKHFSQEERYRIAMVMIEIMASNDISVDQIYSDRKLFEQLLTEAIRTLTQAGKLS